MNDITSEIEIEFKSKITEIEYEKLMKKYSHDGDFISQTNYYFDTHDMFYNRNNTTIRIREKNKQYKLTEKSPSENCSIEKSVKISEKKAMFYIKNGLDKDLLGFVGNLEYLASLKTDRLTFDYKCGLICLDKSFYGKIQEFEVEYEAENVSEKIKFNEFLKNNNLIYRKTPSKRERALKEMNSK